MVSAQQRERPQGERKRGRGREGERGGGREGEREGAHQEERLRVSRPRGLSQAIMMWR